jgi:outer membrane protein assembly factor BamB
VALKDDAPRGALVAADLDGNGATEVIMLTNRGHVVAVNASDGKILWDAPGASDAASIALADVNGDRVLDVLIAGGQEFAMALSGRDGSLLWKEESAPLFVANHTGASLMPRSLVAVAHGSGALLIGVDPSRVGLRAVEFSKGRVAAASY